MACLLEISMLDEIKPVNIIESLMGKNVIDEKMENEEIIYHFSHMKIQEYVYLEMSYAKRRILHSKSAFIFEKKLMNSFKESFYYSKIIYHYDKSGNIYTIIFVLPMNFFL